MRPLLLLVGLAFVAGCFEPPAATRSVDGAICEPEFCDLLATVDPPERQANELSIAVNPLDPLNIIATGKDYTPEEAGDCTWAGIYTTFDGGKTWTNQNVPGSPWRKLADPSAPTTVFTRFWCVTDPVVAFGPDGTAYWTVMPYQCDRASGSKMGRDIHPKGGFNDWAWTCSAMYVLTSTDGGLSWPIERAREVAFGAGLAHDKQWLAVAPDGERVLLCWDYGGPDGGLPSPLPGGLPVPPPSRPRLDPGGVVCSISEDKGDSWSDFALATRAGGFPWIEFDGTGRAWMGIADGFENGTLLVLQSDDGLRWSEPVEVMPFVNGPDRNEYGWPTLRGSSFRLVPYAALAVDKSGGAHDGRIYVAAYDHAGASSDVFLSWSDDGKKWSAPARVNDDAEDADQFLPVVSVGPDGTVDVSWQDRRDDPENRLFHTYYSYSVDGGVTFSRNLRVTNVASDEQHSHHQNGMVFLGDYRDSDSLRGRAILNWVDTRDAKADVRIATILRPEADRR